MRSRSHGGYFIMALLCVLAAVAVYRTSQPAFQKEQFLGAFFRTASAASKASVAKLVGETVTFTHKGTNIVVKVAPTVDDMAREIIKALPPTSKGISKVDLDDAFDGFSKALGNNISKATGGGIDALSGYNVVKAALKEAPAYKTLSRVSEAVEGANTALKAAGAAGQAAEAATGAAKAFHTSMLSKVDDVAKSSATFDDFATNFTKSLTATEKSNLAKYGMSVEMLNKIGTKYNPLSNVATTARMQTFYKSLGLTEHGAPIDKITSLAWWKNLLLNPKTLIVGGVVGLISLGEIYDLVNKIRDEVNKANGGGKGSGGGNNGDGSGLDDWLSNGGSGIFLVVVLAFGSLCCLSFVGIAMYFAMSGNGNANAPNSSNLFA